MSYLLPKFLFNHAGHFVVTISHLNLRVAVVL